jgi:hypothetical protein
MGLCGSTIGEGWQIFSDFPSTERTMSRRRLRGQNHNLAANKPQLGRGTEGNQPPLAVVTPGALLRSCTGALIQRSPLGGSQLLRPLSQSRKTLIRRSNEHGVFDAS